MARTLLGRILLPLLVLTMLATACSSDDSTTTAEGSDAAVTSDSSDAAPADSGSDESGSDEQGSIWVLLPDSATSARWETDDRRFFEASFDEAGVDYNIVNAEGDAQQQVSQAEQAIASGAEVILFVNLDAGSGAAIIQLAREADVAVIDYDRLTIEGEGADVYVSFDNVEVGRTMGTVLEPAIEERDAEVPRVIMLNGGPTDNNATLFREGYFETVEPRVEAGEWELIADEAVPDWDNAQALTIFEQLLIDAGNDVDGVFAANDGLANSVIAARKNAGLDPFPVSGQDATVGGIQNILAGDQTMTVYKPIQAEAEAAAQAAIALLNGEDIASMADGLTINNGTTDVPFIALTPVAVTADNVADTVIADGFRTWEEICVGDFEEFCPADR